MDPSTRVGVLGARDRRLVEVARAVVGRPRVVLLDEPAAGLPDEETAHLGEVIRRIPEEIGALTVLVDHDMSLVSGCCATTAVLDFGKLLAAGPTAEVLRDERVIRAYLGTEDVEGGDADDNVAAGAVPEESQPVSDDALSLKDVSVERGGHTVVHGVSLDVAPGAVTALLGPNGAGKSSLVLAVGGVLKPARRLRGDGRS